jgi:phage gp29-like protein
MTDRPDTSAVAQPTRFGPRTVAGQVDVDTLTPRQIKRMLLAAESGDPAAQAELFERMEEKDGELDAHLRTRKAGVLRLAWELEPADASEQAARAAELCRSALEALPGLHQALFDLLDAVPKGYSVLEVDWRTEPGRWRPARLTWRPQRWFVPDEDGGALRMRAEGGELVDVNPLNFLVHRVQARSGFCARTGLLRSCVRAFVVRHFAWKDWLAFAEVYGMPPRVGWLREDAAWDSDEARELWQAVRGMGMDAAAVVREGNRIEVLDSAPDADGSLFEKIIERAGRELTLAVLGQTLTSGGEGGGSRALGQVHEHVRWDLVQSDAEALGRTLTEQLLEPVVRLNLGPGYPAPRWRFATDRPEDLGRLATTVKTLSEAGLPIPADWAYRRFGIPRPADDEPVLAPR